MTLEEVLQQKFSANLQLRIKGAKDIAVKAADRCADQVFQELSNVIIEESYPNTVPVSGWPSLEDGWKRRKAKFGAHEWFIGLSLPHLSTQLKKLSGTKVWGKTTVQILNAEKGFWGRTQSVSKWMKGTPQEFALTMFPKLESEVGIELTLGEKDIADKLRNRKRKYRKLLGPFVKWYLHVKVRAAVDKALKEAGYAVT